MQAVQSTFHLHPFRRGSSSYFCLNPEPPPPPYTQALKLYYSALEAILSGERAASVGSLPVLIQATKFHKGLMACCLEVVIAAYK